MMTRRTFVGAFAALTAAGGSGLSALLARRRRLTMAGIAPATVRPLVGQPVRMRYADGRQLDAVVRDICTKNNRARFGAPATEQISLLLQANDHDAKAGFYRVESDDLVLGDLYFSPVGPEGSERRLEAVITRIV